MSFERCFKKTMNKIGVVMIIFVVLLNLLFFIQGIASNIVEKNLSPITANVISELLYGAAYFASFIIPGIILCAIMGKDRTPLMLDKRLPPARDTAAYIVASIAMILVMAVINADLVSIFNYSEYSSEFLWDNEPLSSYQFVLSFIKTAIVPAICEEFLFRGAILSALKPYGKAPAIIISAVLFGLMHQNAEQFLYTTVAGLVLGWIVYETGSVWCGILVHFYNNFFSVFESAILERIPQEISYPIIYALEGVVFILGLVSAVYLISKHFKDNRSQSLSDLGIYGKSLEEINSDETIPERPLPGGKIAKLFFSPTIIVFIVISVFIMLLNIIMSIIYFQGL